MKDFVKYIIITPSHNRPNELERCIRSFLNSDHKYTKMAIYVDGGRSEDIEGYKDLKKIYTSEYPDLFHIFEISEDNRGVVYARDYLMNNSYRNCSYMIWVDDDQMISDKNFEMILDDELYEMPINYFNLHNLICESGPSSLSEIINLCSENTIIINSSYWKTNDHFIPGEVLTPEYLLYYDIAGVNGYYKHKGSFITYTPNPDDPDTLTGKTKDESWWRDVNPIGYTLFYNLIYRLIITGELELKPELQSRMMRWHLKQSIYNMIRYLGEEETSKNLHKVLNLDIIRDLV